MATWDFSNSPVTFDNPLYTFAGGVGQNVYPPSRIEMSCPTAGPGGLYYPRYPNGNVPTSGLGTAAAADTTSGAAALTTKIQLGAAAADTTSGAGTLFAFTFTNASPLPSALVGSAYSVTFGTVGGTAPITMTESGAVPGLAWTAPTDAGTPSAAGNYNVTVTATDSSGTSTYPTITTHADNEGFPNANQQPGAGGNPNYLTTAATLTAAQYVLYFGTVATFGGSHTNRTLADTLGNFTNAVPLVSLIGPSNPNPSQQNNTQETDMWGAVIATGGADVFTQNYYSGDRDYQAAFFLELAGVTAVIAKTGQIQGALAGGAGTGVAASTTNSVCSNGGTQVAQAGSTITVTAAQVPCLMISLCCNLSVLGTNGAAAAPTVGSSMPGTAVGGWDGMQFWQYLGTGAPAFKTACLSVRQITAAGTYTAYFNNPSNSDEWFQTIVWMGQGFASAPRVVTKTFGLTVAAPTSGYDGIAKVDSSGVLVNGAGFAIIGVGFNASGLETSCAQGFAPWYGSPPDWTTLFSLLNPIIVRIPVNAASWLGLTCNVMNAGGTAWASTGVNASGPSGMTTYRNAVITAAGEVQSRGAYVLFDLHWSAPDFTFGGVRAHTMPSFGQPAFMNSDTDGLFHTSFATYFGTAATPQVATLLGGGTFTLQNAGILIDLFNEPYLDGGLGWNSTTWAAMKAGGSTIPSFPLGTYSGTIVAQSWTTYGYQQALNAWRTPTHVNVLVTGGGGYASNETNFTSWMPSDTLSQPQICVGAHPYQVLSGLSNTTDQYPQGNSNWVANSGALAVMAANIPLLFTEDGGYYNTVAAYGATEAHVTYMANWCTANGVNLYISWAGQNGSGGANPGSSGTNELVYATTPPTLTGGQGECFAAIAATFGAPAVAMPTFSPVAGSYTGTQNVAITTLTAGAQIYYTTNNTTPTPDSQKYTGTPIPVSVSETLQAMATKAGSTQSAVNIGVYTISSGSGINLPADFFVTMMGQTSPGSAPVTGSANGNPDQFGILGSPYMGLGWPAAVAGLNPVAGYNIRRSTDQATWTQIGTNVPGTPDQYGTCFADTNAANCVGSAWGPTNGMYCAATTYYYQMQTVDSKGNVSAWSGYPKQYVYLYGSGGQSTPSVNSGDGGPSAGGGYKWAHDLNSGYTSSYAASDPTYVEVWSTAENGGGGYMLPVAGWVYPAQNQWIGACPNMCFLMKVSSTSVVPGLHGEVVGDLGITATGALAPGSATNLDMRPFVAGGAGAYAANVYQLYTIPRTEFMVPAAGWPGSSTADGILQHAMYKWLIQDAGSGGTITIAKCWFGP